MKLSREQLSAIGDHQMRLFEAKMIAHLQRYLTPEGQVLEEERARRAVRAGVLRAARHGITAEYDVGRFIDLAFALGEDFDERAPFSMILAEPLHAHLRVNQLCRAAIERPAEGQRGA